jgi:muconolactone delta-isomerase
MEQRFACGNSDKEEEEEERKKTKIRHIWKPFGTWGRYSLVNLDHPVTSADY